MRIGSLFSGVGGLELGIERATGGKVVWQVEQDEWCRGILARHWPEAERFNDVCEVGASNLAEVDVICGGFPCTDLSFAGPGAGLAGARSGLWWEYARIIRELRPRIVVVENVAALLVRGLGDVLGELAASGYDAVWDCVPASAVGAPHERDRLFIVAVLADAERQRQPRSGTHGDGRREAPRADREADQSDDGVTQQRRRRDDESRMGRVADGFSAGLDAIRARGDRWPARPGEEPFAWEAPRATRGVAQRADRLMAMGNAVVPQVAEVIGCTVKAAWENV